jgi:2-C-methyl-D-erythritol 2,4-cyclodiphosphate synthase
MPNQVRFPRTGIGYDVHRFAEGRPLVLGGVQIAHEKGLDGHSDADALLHAIADAILGAAAMGDIGQHFPPGDDRWKGADSRDLLRRSVEIVTEAGWTLVNVDATVIAEAPKINPHSAAMRLEIREATGLPIDAISIKATTNEGMGFVGREEGIAALAIATIVPSEMATA